MNFSECTECDELRATFQKKWDAAPEERKNRETIDEFAAIVEHFLANHEEHFLTNVVSGIFVEDSTPEERYERLKKQAIAYDREYDLAAEYDNLKKAFEEAERNYYANPTDATYESYTSTLLAWSEFNWDVDDE